MTDNEKADTQPGNVWIEVNTFKHPNIVRVEIVISDADERLRDMTAEHIKRILMACSA